jgi:hypothetical protein
MNTISANCELQQQRLNSISRSLRSVVFTIREIRYSLVRKFFANDVVLRRTMLL